MAKRFLGTVLRLEPKRNGAYIRPIWGNEQGTEDLFVSFKESPKLEIGLNVSFELGHETKTGRWCCQKISLILDGVCTERPDFLPSALYLDLMRIEWKHSHDKDAVLALEQEYFNSLDAKHNINSSLSDLGINVKL